MSTGAAMQAVIGSDVTVPAPVKYGEPKPKQKGLDWATISPPVVDSTLPPTTAEVRSQQMAQHAEAIERVERLEGRRPRKPRAQTPNSVDHPAVRRALESTEPGRKVSVTQVTPEIRAVAEVLQQTTNSKDMVVAACRAAVIAAADALRGASLRAAEGRVVRPETAASPRRDGRKQMGQPRLEEKHPEMLDKIRHLYFDEARGIQWIAAELELSPNTVSRVMHRNGMQLRPIGESNENSRVRVQARLDALGVTSLQVRQWAADHGIDVRERGFLPEDVLTRFETSR